MVCYACCISPQHSLLLRSTNSWRSRLEFKATANEVSGQQFVQDCLVRDVIGPAVRGSHSGIELGVNVGEPLWLAGSGACPKQSEAAGFPEQARTASVGRTQHQGRRASPCTPGKAVPFPHIRPAPSTGVLERSALEAVVIALGVDISRGWFAKQSAQVNEVLLCRGAFLQFRGAPLLDELVRDHRYCQTILLRTVSA